MFDLPAQRPALMGVLNVTPDSFSDGGQYLDSDAAVARGIAMVEEGADLIDVGGESTRPGAADVPIEEELRRVLPVVRGLRTEGAAISIDTRKPEVAKATLDEGACVVNDVSGFRDSRMIDVCAAHDCSICIMHMLGSPKTMQLSPAYRNVVEEVRSWLLNQAEICQAGGIQKSRIWIDPGIGFGKTLQHNLELLAKLDRFTETALPVLVGVSRKSFIGRVLADADGHGGADERLEGSIAAQVLAQASGAKIIRTHDVRASRRAMDLATAILSAGNA